MSTVLSIPPRFLLRLSKISLEHDRQICNTLESDHESNPEERGRSNRGEETGTKCVEEPGRTKLEIWGTDYSTKKYIRKTDHDGIYTRGNIPNWN